MSSIRGTYQTGAVHILYWCSLKLSLNYLRGFLIAAWGRVPKLQSVRNNGTSLFSIFQLIPSAFISSERLFSSSEALFTSSMRFCSKSFFTSRAILFSPQLSPFTIPFSMPLFSTLSSTSHISSVKVTACPKDKASTSQPTHRLSFRVLTQRVSVPHSACPIALH